jgi:hypothetical protein
MDENLQLQQDQEQYDVKYMRELREYWNAYMFALISEIYTGVAINLGLTPAQAYALAKSNPSDLKKAEFFKGLFERFKNIFNYRIPKFRYKQKLYGAGNPMSPRQWQKFEDYIDKYWRKYTDPVAEDITIKSHMLGRQTTDFRRKKKPYKNKSLFQVATDQYQGRMPRRLLDAYKRYDFANAEKNALNKQYSSIAMYVKNSGDEIQNAIRNQVQTGIENNRSPVEVASDMYWNIEKNEKLTNKYSAETLRRNWSRVASTEMAASYEAAILAPYEAEAMESLKDPERARYFVFTGGQCKWCTAHHGVLVRIVPSSIVPDTGNDSLKAMGIHDPNTDIAVWIGKSNAGYKETKAVHEWRVVAPAHPNNVATMQPIDIETEWYNPKTGDVEHRQAKKKFVPQQVDYSQKSEEEEDWRKPTFIGDNLVRFNGNIYEAVDAGEYNKRLDESRKDPMLPIPVNRDSPGYRKIFGEAEKNK